LCPSPWRVPTSADFCTLDKKLNYSSTCSNSRSGVYGSTYNSALWGGSYGGYCDGSGVPSGQGMYAFYWSSSEGIYGRAPNLYYRSTSVNPQWSVDWDTGLQVRCVQ
jgi:uncharacterized protein (TIGR02145 family)